jgi:tRNA dimethylallyltransferase
MNLIENLNVLLEMKTVSFILGPTGIGKTEISLLLADKLPVEIISADSRQIYRYLNIGTAKPSKEVLGQVKHHFIDHVSPTDYYSAGMFGREARKIGDLIFESGKMPLVVGGSGFYIQALIDGFSEINVADQGIRDRLEKRLDDLGLDTLYKELVSVDPDLANNLKPGDKQRIVRGLEVFYAAGTPLSQLQQTKAKPADFKSVMIGLNADRELLYERINSRVDEMITIGLVDEVKQLKKRGLTEKVNALNTVGYKEVFDYLNGKFDLDEMKDKIKMNSRRYAKRQLTWFRKDSRIIWFNIDEFQNKADLIEKILVCLEKKTVS